MKKFLVSGEGRKGRGGRRRERGRGGKSDELFCVSDVGEAEGRKEDVVGVVSAWLGRKNNGEEKTH